MNIILRREARQRPVTIGTSSAASSTVRIADWAAAVLHVAGLTATASVSVYGSFGGVEFAEVFGTDGQAATVSLQVGSSAVAVPDAVFGMEQIKFVSATDLGTAVAASVSLKS